MLAAAERWGGGADERPYLPRAFSYARARRGRHARASCSRRSAPARSGWPSCEPGEGLALRRPARDRLAAARRAGTRPLLVGGGIGTAPLLCLQDELGPDATVLLGFRSAAHAEAARAVRRRARRSPPTTARPGARRSSPSCCASELDADARATVFACGPPPMLEAVRAICAERERAGPARARVRDGLRLRRLLRLRGAHPRGLRPPVRRRARCSTPASSSRPSRGPRHLMRPLRRRAARARS